MENQELNADEDPRSSIWTVPSNDLAKFFFVYALIYVIGSGCVVWLQLTRTASPHDIASGIITGVSLIGIGIAPSLALVLVETWRVTMIFTRSLELKQQRREIAIRSRERAVQERVAEISERETEISERVAEISERETGIKERETGIKERTAEIQKRETGVRERVAEIREREAGVEEREAVVRHAQTKLAEERARFEKERAEFERRKNGH